MTAFSHPSLSAADDEALWFPVHMSGGDSFSRPTGIDGAGDDGPEDHDAIGLPGRRPAGPGGKPPAKKSGAGLPGWVWFTLCGAAALGIAVVVARKEIAESVAESWLKGQGVSADIKLDAFSLNHVSGAVLILDGKKPNMSIGRFDVDYGLNLFAGGGLPLARVERIHLVKPVLAFSIKDGKLNFGTLDKIVQDALSAPASNAPPPRDILIEDATVTVDSDYGILTGHGGISLHNGQLAMLDLRLPTTHLTGKLGVGDLHEGRITARSVNTGKNGDQLHVQAHMTGDNWTVRAGGNLVETIGAEEERFYGQNIVLELDAYLPYRHAKSMYEAFSGPTAAVFDLRADEVRNPGLHASAFKAHLQLDGQLKTNEKGSAYSGGADVTSSADSFNAGDMQIDTASIEGRDLQLNTGFSSETGLAFNLTGPVRGDVGLLQQGDLLLKAAHIDLGELAMASDSDGARATFSGDMTLGHLATGDVSLDQTTASLEGGAQAGGDAGPWNVTLKSNIASNNALYRGLNAMARDRAQARIEAAKVPPKPGVPLDPGPDAIIALDRALDRFSLRVKGLNVAISGDSPDATPQVAVRMQGAEAGLKGSGKVTLAPHATKPVYSNTNSGAFGLALSGPDLPQIALAVDNLGPASGNVAAGSYSLAAQINFDPVSGIKFDGHGRFILLNGGGISATLDNEAHVIAQSAELGDHIENLSATLRQNDKTFLVFTPNAWRASGAFSDLALIAPNEVVGLKGGLGAFEAYSLAEGVGFKADLTTSTVSDGVPEDETRFSPLLMSGTIGQDRKALTGRFFAATPSIQGADGKPLRIVAIHLDNDVASGAGALTFKTRDLNFVPDGLQPIHLSPLVAAIFGRKVTGPMSFEGAFNWTKASSSSDGVLTMGVSDFVAATERAPYGVGMSFLGSTGASQGLTGQIRFDSLAPLHTQPGQKVHLARTELGIPLTDLDLSLQILGDHLTLESAKVESPGGQVRLEPTDIYFDAKMPIKGVLAFDGLDFGEVIAATSLNKSMSFKGHMTGRLPFVYDQGHLKFVDGTMQSDAPGQISIYRTAVTGVNTATGTVTSDAPSAAAALAAKNAQAAADPAFNPFQDLAYQAMEYVTYDQLDARLNSRDDLILNINFHIKGYFDPPHQQKANISLFDYISGKWLQKPITLPSRTPVELYLEMPINLDEMLNDLTNFNLRMAQKPQ
ncbi:intermembrane phospholipid transport protein YdbH family protein [Asticcacaulis benevestitus]|nr:YdbH domain-containing protein [Asticcacaulis benevestitus]